MSKGSNRRPSSVSQDEYSDKWARAFGQTMPDEDFAELQESAKQALAIMRGEIEPSRVFTFPPTCHTSPESEQPV